MAKDDEAFQLRIHEIEGQIAKDTKGLVKQLAAWKYFLHWASSYSPAPTPGHTNADIHLTVPQSAEFAFNHSTTSNPDSFVLFAQDSNYDWLTHIGVKCIAIEPDGVVVFIGSLDSSDLYVSGLSFKIFASKILMSRLLAAQANSMECYFGKMKSKYNPDKNLIEWELECISDYSVPVVADSMQARQL